MKFIFVFIALLIGATLVAKSQSEYDDFISEVLNEYKKHEKQFIRKSNRIVKASIEDGFLPKTPIDSVEYIVIPTVLLHRYTNRLSSHKKMNIRDLLSYVNPKSMRYGNALIAKEGNVVGYIQPSYNPNFWAQGIYVSDNLEVYLSDYCKSHKPDLIFRIAAWANLQVTPIFIIKDDTISVLCEFWNHHQKPYIKEYSLDEFIENNEEIMGFETFMYLPD